MLEPKSQNFNVSSNSPLTTPSLSLKRELSQIVQQQRSPPEEETENRQTFKPTKHKKRVDSETQLFNQDDRVDNLRS